MTQTSAVLMKLLITHFSPVSCHFLSFRLKHFLQQPFLRHPQTMFLLNYTRCVLLTVGHNPKVPHCRHVCRTKLQTKLRLRHIAVPNSVCFSSDLHTTSPAEGRPSLRGRHVDSSPSNINTPSARPPFPTDLSPNISAHRIEWRQYCSTSTNPRDYQLFTVGRHSGVGGGGCGRAQATLTFALDTQSTRFKTEPAAHFFNVITFIASLL